MRGRVNSLKISKTRIDYFQNNEPLIPSTLKEWYEYFTQHECLPDMDVVEEMILLDWVWSRSAYGFITFSDIATKNLKYYG